MDPTDRDSLQSTNTEMRRHVSVLLTKQSKRDAHTAVTPTTSDSVIIPTPDHSHAGNGRSQFDVLIGLNGSAKKM
jgi:hypothetical protein